MSTVSKRLTLEDSFALNGRGNIKFEHEITKQLKSMLTRHAIKTEDRGNRHLSKNSPNIIIIIQI